MSHSPLYSTLEPFAALILIPLLKRSVLNLSGISLFFSTDTIHFPAPEAQSALYSLSQIVTMALQPSFLPIFTISVHSFSTVSWSNVSLSVPAKLSDHLFERELLIFDGSSM